MPRTIALLTDFGYRDGYVGVMKGVLAMRCPGASVIDLTHGIPPQEILTGALQLASAVPYFPPDTVFLAVVDPGVGSDRRALCLHSGGRLFVGPDNGLLWPAAAGLGQPEAFCLDRPETWLPAPGATFHGRDIFAPVAAALAGGEDPDQLGTPIPDPVRLEIPRPELRPGGWAGQVILIDGYGNAVTNLRPEDLGHPAPRSVRFRVGSREVCGPDPCYAAVPPGSPLVVAGSFGYFELSLNRGNAAGALGLRAGDPVFAVPSQAPPLSLRHLLRNRSARLVWLRPFRV